MKLSEFTNNDYVVYNVGNLDRVVARDRYGLSLEFYDNKLGDPAFIISQNGSATRVLSVAMIGAPRADYLPKEARGNVVWCADPRVIMSHLICFWAQQNSEFLINDQELNELINPICSYAAASEWVRKNEFVLTPSALDYRHNDYIDDYTKLKFPPKYDFSKFKRA